MISLCPYSVVCAPTRRSFFSRGVGAKRLWRSHRPEKILYRIQTFVRTKKLGFFALVVLRNDEVDLSKKTKAKKNPPISGRAFSCLVVSASRFLARLETSLGRSLAIDKTLAFPLRCNQPPTGQKQPSIGAVFRCWLL